MATEKNPYEVDAPVSNVIALDVERDPTDNVSIEIDPETGEVEVDFGSVEVEIDEDGIAVMEKGGFYENLVEIF